MHVQDFVYYRHLSPGGVAITASSSPVTHIVHAYGHGPPNIRFSIILFLQILGTYFVRIFFDSFQNLYDIIIRVNNKKSYLRGRGSSYETYTNQTLLFKLWYPVYMYDHFQDFFATPQHKICFLQVL